MLLLNVYGRFKLVEATGVDVTPTGLKARGLLALLALTTGHCRSRVWLQDKLWSDRDARRGADSLRQALMDIRRALGAHAHVLHADREKVGLDPRHFTVVYDRPHPRGGGEEDGEVFSDLLIRDPEFEEWIRDRRLALTEAPLVSAGSTSAASRDDNPAIFFRCQNDGLPESRVVTRHLVSLATASLLDFADFPVFGDGGDSPPAPLEPYKAGLVVKLATTAWPGHACVTVTIGHPASDRVFWSRSFHIVAWNNPYDQERLHPVAAGIVEAALSVLRQRRDELRLRNCAALSAHHGRGLIFRFDRTSLAEADRHLRFAWNHEPRPQYLAWRAFLRNMANFQHRTCDFLDDPIDIETLAQEAIRQAPGSAVALGVGAHIEYLSGGSHRSSLQLARRAVGYDPLNAVNFAILSNTELVLGQREESRRSALQALALAGAGDHRAFAEFFGCMSAAALGDYRAAIDHAEAALVLRPAFRAPLRYLVALYKCVGTSADRERVLARMRRLEPDFHEGRLVETDYPVTTMQRMRLIDMIAR